MAQMGNERPMNDQARPSDTKKLSIPGVGGSLWEQSTEVELGGEDTRPGPWSSVPWRTIVAAVAIVAATFFAGSSSRF